MEKLFISKQYDSAIGHISAVSSEKGVRQIIIGSNLPTLKTGDPFCVLSQIMHYFEGAKNGFDIPVDIIVSDFTKNVLDATRQIPFGTTSTYGGIAKAIGNPAACRAVGGALNRNPLPIIIPCHRILAKNNIGGYAFGLSSKLTLLDLEDIHIK